MVGVVDVGVSVVGGGGGGGGGSVVVAVVVAGGGVVVWACVVVVCGGAGAWVTGGWYVGLGCGGGGAGTSLVTVTVLGGGGSAGDGGGVGDSLVAGGGGVVDGTAGLRSPVSAMVTPPTAAMTAKIATPNTTSGSRCQALDGSGATTPAGGTYCAMARVVVVSPKTSSPV